MSTLLQSRIQHTATNNKAMRSADIDIVKILTMVVCSMGGNVLLLSDVPVELIVSWETDEGPGLTNGLELLGLTYISHWFVTFKVTMEASHAFLAGLCKSQ